MKRGKGGRYNHEVAERERRAMTKAALAYQPPGRAAETSEMDRRFLARGNSEEVAAAEAYARERRLERERELKQTAAPKQPLRRVK